AYPVALAGRCIHHRPGFMVNTLQQPLLSPAFWGGLQRPRQAPRRSSSTLALGLSFCCPPALEPSASVATTAWRSSSGGLYATESPWYRHGPSATTAAVRYSGGCFSDGIRCSSSRRSSSRSSNTSGCEAQEEARETSTAGATVATRGKARAEGDFVGHEGDGEDLSTSMAGGSEMEPLVERVASTLEQRCTVCGGDLVCVFRSVCVIGRNGVGILVIARVSVLGFIGDIVALDPSCAGQVPRSRTKPAPSSGLLLSCTHRRYIASSPAVTLRTLKYGVPACRARQRYDSARTFPPGSHC
ncbi:unnamed protein product, partial [Ectocarpus sp. 8 AP-2014]